jgi:hypothetical protein
MDGRKSLRAICFTYFLEPQEIFQMPENTNYKRWVYQTEVCPETNRIHIQGYIGFNKPTKWATVLQWFKDNGLKGIHIKESRGTYLQNYKYCTKEESKLPNGQAGEFGDFGPNKGQGARSDLTEVTEIIKETGSLKRAAEDYPETYVRNYRGLADYKEQVRPTKKRRVTPKDVNFLWIYGGTGNGKTEYFDCNWPDGYEKEGSHKWWDKYDGEDAIFINDYRPGREAIRYENLLKLMDVYPFSGEKKGGIVQVTATVVVVTSSMPPWQFFREEKNHELELSQLNRRCRIGQLVDGRFVEDETSSALRLGAATRVLGLGHVETQRPGPDPAMVRPTATPSGSLTETDQ